MEHHDMKGYFVYLADTVRADSLTDILERIHLDAPQHYFERIRTLYYRIPAEEEHAFLQKVMQGLEHELFSAYEREGILTTLPYEEGERSSSNSDENDDMIRD